jgi:hypothetical protein
MGNTDVMTGVTDGEAIDALYAGAPEEFIAARDALAKAADAADRPAIKGLRKPTVAGWLVNQLVRTHGDTVEELLEIGARLRSAQNGGHGDELRALAAERRRVTDVLIGAARAIAGDAQRAVTADLQAAVASSLDAAVADAALAAQLRSGRLTDALSYAGFGALGLMSVPTGDDGGLATPVVPGPKRAAGPATPAVSARDRSAGQRAAEQRAAERRAAELAEGRRHEAEAAAAAARDERRTAEERLRLAEHALSDARMNLDLARRAEKAAIAALDKVKGRS